MTDNRDPNLIRNNLNDPVNNPNNPNPPAQIIQ